MSTKPQNIVIVGGGGAGIATWNALSTRLDAKKHNLILVTSRPFFTHLPAGHRMAVTSKGHLEDCALMPLGEKFNTGNKKLIVASVTSIVDQDQQGGYVVLDNGEKVEYSILILAPGTRWEGPLDLPNTKAEAVEVLNTWRSRFAKAENIVLVGGGAVGLELAGEIKDIGPKKNVTIVHAQSLYLNNTYPEKYRKYIVKQFAARGINAMLGEYVDDLEIKDGCVVTRSGKKIAADLVVPTRGGRPNTKFIASLGPDVLTPSGNVKVGQTLQLVNHPRIFAAGDVINWEEQKQFAKTAGHANVIKENVLILLGLSKKKPVLYKGAIEMIVVTNGKYGGAGYFGVLWGILIGNWLSSFLKSKSLLIGLTKYNLSL
ncbi:FAD/NAD(P)-binding domain-containing protein [Pholiota conissans]|uniref:FAD/NAD(P)-binding domain-containing protein n=1 Tax=Pholiota conissans TaxID=109636 RepID=A0A9P5YLN9_9AGAR|nr:FAD/NAD(P)-binding domain-containing protein [Pholiota conissans]